MHEPGSGAGDPSDEALAGRVQRGEAEALERLVRRYLHRVHAVMASYLRERADVEDAVQETFLRVLGRIASYEPTRPFAPWVYQIARNVARDRLATRARQRAERLPLDAPTRATRPDLATENAEIRAIVEAAVGELPEQQRTVFRLHDVEGYHAEEIAGMMGLTAGTIRSHLHHARRALRGALAARLGEPRNAGG